MILRGSGVRARSACACHALAQFSWQVATVGEPWDLTRQIEECLGRNGIAGAVTLEGDRFVLTGFGPKVAVVANSDLERFGRSNERERRQIAERIARDLAASRRARMTTGSGRSAWLEWLRLLVAVAAVGAGVWCAWRWLGRPAVQAANTGILSDGDVTGTSRVQSEAARTPGAPRLRSSRHEELDPSANARAYVLEWRWVVQ
ncbi:MAG: hypothetical protein QM784_00695 [Polyangiaceae bacterium]